MKFKLLLALTLALGLAGTALAAEWYEGGTLHRATLAQWNQASSENKIATTSDMIVATCDQDLLMASGGMDKLKEATHDVTLCIEGVAGEARFAEQTVAETSVMCMAYMKENYPFFLAE